MTTRLVLTYRDYLALPDDGRRWELHDGEIAVTPAPSPAHQELSGNLFAVLREHVKDRALGKVFFAPVDCVLSDTTVVQPDIVFVDAAHLSIVKERGVMGPPALVVEILSPSTLDLDRRVKFQLYARHGVRFYWIADLASRTIEAYALVERGYDLQARLAGDRGMALPPFERLLLVPGSLWPADRPTA